MNKRTEESVEKLRELMQGKIKYIFLKQFFFVVYSPCSSFPTLV